LQAWRSGLRPKKNRGSAWQETTQRRINSAKLEGKKRGGTTIFRRDNACRKDANIDNCARAVVSQSSQGGRRKRKRTIHSDSEHGSQKKSTPPTGEDYERMPAPERKRCTLPTEEEKNTSSRRGRLGKPALDNMLVPKWTKVPNFQTGREVIFFPKILSSETKSSLIKGRMKSLQVKTSQSLTVGGRRGERPFRGVGGQRLKSRNPKPAVADARELGELICSGPGGGRGKKAGACLL